MIADYTTQATGYPTEIKELKEFRFFPTITANFEGLSMKDKTGKTVMGSVDSVRISMNFFSAIFKTGKIKSFDIQNLVLEPGVALPKRIIIDQATILDDEKDPNKAQFVVKGLIGGDVLAVSVGVTASGSGRSRYYGLGPYKNVKAQFDDVFAAFVMRKDGSNMSISDIKVTQAEKPILSGDLQMDGGFASNTITGDVKIGKDTQAQPHVKIGDGGKISGDIVFPQVAPQELAALMGGIAKVQEKLAPKKKSSDKTQEIDLSALNMDLNLDLQSILLDGKSIGHQKAEIKADDGAVSVHIGDGVLLSGSHDTYFDLKPDGKHGRHLMTLVTQMSGANMNMLMDNTDVKIDADIDVSASLMSFDDVKKNLNGQVAIVSDGGQFESRLLNAWGSGLLNALMPRLKPKEEAKMNCAIIRSDIQKGYADVKTIYVDTKRLTVMGKGGYNLASDVLDLKIEPEAKDISIGDLSAAVKIRGSLAKPKVSADAVDLGKTAAGALLSAVNPAFLALTTDLNILGDSKKDKMPDLCATVHKLPKGNKAASYLKIAQ